MKIYSSGGLGDALLVFAKIINNHGLHKSIQRKFWKHSDRYPEYAKPINDIMKSFLGQMFLTSDSSYHCVEKDKKGSDWAITEASNNGGAYILTHTRDPVFPLPDKIQWPIGNSPSIQCPLICIGLSAGRKNDGSKRTVSCIRQIVEKFSSSHAIITIGTEEQSFDGATYVPTESILDAFGLIEQCSGFIGQDGVLSYYALLQNKPTVINFHSPGLVEHYMCDQWAKNSVILNGHNKLELIPGAALEEFAKKLLQK